MTWIVGEVRPSSLKDIADVLAGDGAMRRWLPKGGGTLLGRGALPSDQVTALDVANCDRVIEHAYDDLTVTVEAGISLAALQNTLFEHGQWLPLSIHPDPRSTVGGWIGADRRTPLAGSWGSVRDYLLGIAWMDGRGHTLRAGGRVVKNVAGYDLMKLFTGSLGELGILIEATFKVLPRPAQWAAVTVSRPDASALCSALEHGPKLFPAGLWRYDIGEGDTLALAFAGFPTRVAAQVAGAEALFLNHVRVLDHDATLTLAARLEHNTRPETDCIAWGGALPEWLCRPDLADTLASNAWCGDLLRGYFWSRWTGDAQTLSRVRDELRSGEGHLHLDAPSPDPLVNPWGSRPDDKELLSRLKQALDPEGRFVDGRWPISR